jgi:hypothetical protein
MLNTEQYDDQEEQYRQASYEYADQSDEDGDTETDITGDYPDDDYDDMPPEADAQQEAEDNLVRESFLAAYVSDFWSGPGSYDD